MLGEVFESLPTNLQFFSLNFVVSDVQKIINKFSLIEIKAQGWLAEEAESFCRGFL